MLCTNCGARLMDADQFCPKCGAKVIKDYRCPDCGALLRDGTKFCHKCGRPVDGSGMRKKRSEYRKEEDPDDDWDDETEGTDIITILTIIIGCVLLVVVAVLGYHLYQQYGPRSYEQGVEESEDGENEFQGQELGDGLLQDDDEETETYTLTVIHNVNVRDYPSTSDSNVLKVAKEGETYICYGSVEDGEWYKILMENGDIGYVFHEYVTID